MRPDTWAFSHAVDAASGATKALPSWSPKYVTWLTCVSIPWQPSPLASVSGGVVVFVKPLIVSHGVPSRKALATSPSIVAVNATPHASAQPHIGVAALVAAGLHGIAAQLTLPPPVDQDPAKLDPRPAGVVQLPESVDDGFKKLAGGRKGVTGSAVANQAVVDLLGDDLVGIVRAVRLFEHAYFAGKTAAEEAAELLERY